MYQLIRSKARSLIIDLLSPFFSPQPGIHILNGHFLSIDNNKSSALFQNLIEKLLKNNIELINIEDAVTRISNLNYQPNINLLSFNKCFISFTFDDGFEECYSKIAPVLNYYNIKAAFFINPTFINGDEIYQKRFLNEILFVSSDKRPLSWKQIAKLHSQGHVIGSHTMEHRNLGIPDIPISELEKQIAESKRIIEINIGAQCNYFAYPYGKIKHFSDKALKVAARYYKYIFSQDDYRSYFSFNGQVINRRHFEPDWSYRHILFFLRRKLL